MIDFRDRHPVSQYASEPLGLNIYVGEVPTDADGVVTVTMFKDAAPTSLVFTRAATRMDVGDYQVTLASSETAALGDYTLVWEYLLGGLSQRYETYLAIGEPIPSYDRLAPTMKRLVDSVWVRFADLFDSPNGGPNLMTYFQSHFNRGRLADLLRIAVGRLNTAAQPYQTYTIDGDGGARFPVDKWGALLEQALYVECLKHLVRSYVEQPAFIGGAVTRLDRRDYMDRWSSVLQSEEGLLRAEMEHFKIRNMGFGRPAVLVSGGVYGRFGPTRLVGSLAARPRYWARFY